MVACRFADQQCSLLKKWTNMVARWRPDQSIGLPRFIFNEGWVDVRDREARGQSVLELCGPPPEIGCSRSGRGRFADLESPSPQGRPEQQKGKFNAIAHRDLSGNGALARL
jgi:hypothetical protein